MNRHGRLVERRGGEGRGDPFPTGGFRRVLAGLSGIGVLKLSRRRLVSSQPCGESDGWGEGGEGGGIHIAPLQDGVPGYFLNCGIVCDG